MGMSNSNYKIEKIIGKLNFNKHPILNQNYTTRLAYVSFLAAALRFGKRNELQVNDILTTYIHIFDIKVTDFNELLNIDNKHGSDVFIRILRLLGFTDISERKMKFNHSYCSKLLLGEMLLFDLNESGDFFNNIIVRLYAEYFEIPIIFVEHIKALLIKMVSNEDVKDLLKLKKNESFKYFFDCMKDYRKHEATDTINVTVIATMSSGKSTLLNALIGKKKFPSENKACTSKYLEFKNNPKLSRELGFASGEHLDSRWNISYDEIRSWNRDAEIDRIELEGMMNSYSMLKKAKISFIDTPGTNNSRDNQHGVITRKILHQRNSNVILYILNATNLAADDDSQLLKEVVKELGNQQIIFLLNKTDQMDLDADDDITDSLRIARAYVMEHGVISPTIIPISTYAAGLFRYILDGGSLTNREKRDALALFRLFQSPKYDMNRYIDKSLIKSLPQSAINVRSHKNIQIDSELLSSKVIYEAMKKTGIHILERLLLQISSISQIGR
ncbi:small GTP-binding protein [Paenibacillus endophyticus]|uniref:Small GTP-binding protein n=1 Tax=Paenibacillus endophyticus TaxID=1294268 RepID=A0A7W5GDH0_9BACL|nr:dynamin family protein [Paenibacillus endophyticus]MBB3155037.1 small GTP-binding protein [Paenibacillus endophyticus]